MDKRIFFLTGEWTALARFVRGLAPEPEGMPSVYLPWLHYKRRGYDVHVFMIGNFKEGRLVDYCGCKIHLVARPRFFEWRNRKKLFRFRFPADCYFLYRAAVAIGGSKPPDIVYSMQPWLSYAGWALTKKYHCTSVKRIYGTWLYHDWFSGHNIRKKLHCMAEFLAWKVPSDMMIISNDGTCGDKLADWLRIDNTKYRMWINGVNKPGTSNTVESDILRRKMGLCEDDFVLVCISRLSHWKRHDRVIKAMPGILKCVPNAKLVLAGDGPARKELENTVNRLGLNSTVHFTGMVVHSKVNEILSIADVFLQVNDLSCLGNTLLEALAAGKAIITWNVGGTRDVITDGSNGRLLPDAEPSTISGAVIELALNPLERVKLAQGARKFAEQDLLSWDERLDREIDLVESIKTG